MLTKRAYDLAVRVKHDHLLVCSERIDVALNIHIAYARF